MKLTFDTERLRLPASVTLQNKLSESAQQSGKLTSATHALIFNFRDTTYDPETGGWHPVEIRIVRLYDQWMIDYITDLSYQGHPYAELVKEVDFNFSDGTASFLFAGNLPINSKEVIEFYQMWQENFLAYLNMGAFDQIVVTTE